MRILYHHRTLADGAEGIHIYEMIKSFRNLGHEVQVVGPLGEVTRRRSHSSKFLAKLKRTLPEFLFELGEIAYNCYGFIKISKAIKRFQPDLIYDRYITFNFSCILAGRRYRCPVFLEVNAPLALERSSQPDERLIFKKLAHWAEKWISSNVSKTIVVSTPLSMYLQSIGVPHNKLLIMPNCVDPIKFSPRPKSSQLLESIGAQKDAVIIGFTGVLRAWHGLDLLIQSAGNLHRKGFQVFLLIVGNGPIRADVERWILEAGIHQYAAVTGRIQHDLVPDYVSLFDIAVSPKATFYASPMKVIEYMGMGKCVVVPNLSNFLDIIDPGIDGEVFKEDDRDSLVSVLTKLCTHSQRRFELGENARKKVETRLNWNFNARSICDLLLQQNREAKQCP